MQNIEERFMQLVRTEFNRKKMSDITLDAAFRKDLGLDSLSLTELIIACEETFGIEIDVDHPSTVEARTLRPLFDAVVQLVDQNEVAK
jgi:acyl carrier protein